MAYIVANYYIGPFQRYDGTGNTDEAQITLFAEREKAIKYIIDMIIELHSDGEDDEMITEEEIVKFKRKLDKWKYCNIRDTYMFTINFAEIKMNVEK